MEKAIGWTTLLAIVGLLTIGAELSAKIGLILLAAILLVWLLLDVVVWLVLQVVATIYRLA